MCKKLNILQDTLIFFDIERGTRYTFRESRARKILRLRPGLALGRSSAEGSYFLLSLAVLAALGGAAAEIAIALLIERLADAGLSGNGDAAARVAIAMAGVIAAGFLLKYAVKATAVSFGARTAYRLRAMLFRRMAKLRQEDAESRLVGDWTSVVANDAYAVEQFMTNHLSNLLFHPLMAAGTLVLLFLLQWKLMLLCCLMMPLALFVSGLLGKPLAGKSQRVQEAEGEVNAQVQDAVLGQTLVKSYGRQRWLRDRFERALGIGLHSSLELERQKALIVPWQILLQSLPFAFCVLYGGWLAIHDDFQPAKLLVFIYVLGYCIQSVSALPELIGQLFATAGAVRRLDQLLAYRTEEEEDGSRDRPPEAAKGENGGTEAERAASAISFQGVNYRYGGRESLALSEITCEIGEGQFVAVVGPSGSGKSTLLKLLGKLYEPESGEIRVFGAPLSGRSHREARSQLAFVTQSTYLFPGTIADNIRFGNPGASDEEMIEASIAAFAHAFINDLPEGYDTRIGERGAGLSGGQMQRLAIARALLKDAPILALDEPTSALDAESEAMIQMTLRLARGKKTVIAVAHRLNTAREADLILVLDRGRIVERGTHEQLLRAGGLYAALHASPLEGVSV